MFQVYKKVDHIPQLWDEIAENQPLLKRETLKMLEEVNPCQQSYHINLDGRMLLVSYQLKIDLFSFTSFFSLKLPVKIIGIPMSVSYRGYAIGNQEGEINEITKYIKSLKGFYLMLNCDHRLPLVKGNTLPNCRFEVRWNSLEAYINSLRSHYRYRVRKALEKGALIEVKALVDNQEFDEGLYQLYEKVYDNSKEKLEKLTIDFFRRFPAKIMTFSIEGEGVAFIQLYENKDTLVFLFGGFEDQHNRQYDLYMNMLLEIIKYAVNRNFKYIDFGQTAEETKLKLGSEQQHKFMYLHHSNRFVNGLLKRLVGIFSYREYDVKHRIFKK